MDSRAILVLGTHSNRALIETFEDMGFSPIVRGSAQGSLEKLRHERFAAVVVDRRFTHADVLEFVLNVRDIDATVPLIVLGKAADGESDKIVIDQKYVMVIDNVKSGRNSADEFQRILNVVVKGKV
jgi:DNA-binding NtrC family response regulator